MEKYTICDKLLLKTFKLLKNLIKHEGSRLKILKLQQTRLYSRLDEARREREREQRERARSSIRRGNERESRGQGARANPPPPVDDKGWRDDMYKPTEACRIQEARREFPGKHSEIVERV